MAKKPSPTEVEAYGYIRQQLRLLGWAVKNPSLNTGGQVWTQNQCLSHETIKKALGTTRPENIVKVSERFLWVIEAKSTRRAINAAIKEATEDYAAPINALDAEIEAILATGVAGNDSEGYTVKTFIKIGDTWERVTINGTEATGLLSPDDTRFLVEQQTNNIHEFAPPQWLFLQAAERINELLHEGGINKNDRAKTMSALLLSVVDQPPNLDTTLPVLIGEINARSEDVLTRHGKPEFAPFVKILPPTNTTNHVKFRAALIQTLQSLLNLNIRSAMNSSTDVLGQFYEVFLKYGNGAKEIGIVLTPRHITRFAVDAVGITPSDIVLDPACGTGGFLVAAFDHVRRHGTPQQLEVFKEHNLFGIEQESAVAVLAIVNMIFRGDGKNNMTEGNCFSTDVVATTRNGYPSATFARQPHEPGQSVVTRVLMNPPFALPSSPDKEFKFASRSLELMADGGIFFSLLPLGCMFGAYDEKIWRSDDLLANHTLLAVVSLPEELFYPAAMKQVVGVVVRKGFPHPKEQPVFWARLAHDGQIKVKKRRMDASDFRPPRTARNDMSLILPLLQNFITHPNSVSVNEPMICKTAPIDFSDPLLELLPEVYLDSPTPSMADLEQEMERMARETAALFIRQAKEEQLSV